MMLDILEDFGESVLFVKYVLRSSTILALANILFSLNLDLCFSLDILPKVFFYLDYKLRFFKYSPFEDTYFCDLYFRRRF